MEPVEDNKVAKAEVLDFVVPQFLDEADNEDLRPTFVESVEYFHRLASYEFRKWSAKPTEFSPRECASRGWICDGKDLLKCVDCRQYLVCSLPPLYDVVLYNKCVERIKEGIISGHSTTCHWRSSPVSPSLTAPCVESKDRGCDAFTQRVVQLASLADVFTNFHNLHVETLINMGISAEDCELLKQFTLTKADIPQSSLNFAIAAGITGWEVEKFSSETPLVSCRYCLRKVGLWLFVKKTGESAHAVLQDSSNNSDDSKEESPVKRRKINDEDRFFNSTTQHERWCPWVEKMSSSYHPFDDTDDYITSTEEIPPPIERWKLLIETLLHTDKRILNDSNSKEIYFVARSLLNDCVEFAVSTEDQVD